MNISNKELRKRLLSERQSIVNILDSINPKDKLNRLNFEEELRSIENQLSELSENSSSEEVDKIGYTEKAEYTSLIFYGEPVIAERGIDASFAADVLLNFQRIVSSLVAARHKINKPRGPVQFRKNTNLHITNIVRGSFGFVIEPIARQTDLFESETAIALQLATKLMVSLSGPANRDQDELLGQTDDRTLKSVERFFNTMKRSDAQLRLETNHVTHDIYELGIDKILENVARLEVEESTFLQTGILKGILPVGHKFELIVDDDLISGSVSKSLSTDVLDDWATEHIGNEVEVELKRREVFRNNESVRISFSLQRIL